MTTEKVGSVPGSLRLATAAQVSSAPERIGQVAFARVTEEDELFLRLDRPGEPWSVHAEVWVGGHLDPELLRAATGAAMERHPMARASLSGSGEDPVWQIADAAHPRTLAVEECDGDDDLDSLRERLLSSTPALDAPPPFELTLARCPNRDALILNLNHGVGDGIGAFRLLASILRAYAGEADPVPDIDPLRMRDLREFAGRRTVGDRIRRLRERSQIRAEHSGHAVTIAPARAHPGGVGGLHPFRLTPDQLERARARRRAPATFNDLLLAALAVSVRSWNDERGQTPGPILLTVPVNIRPPEWSAELIANLAATLGVSVPPAAQIDLDAAQLAVAERTQRLKSQDFAEMLASGGVIPVWLRRLIGPLLPAPSEEPAETAILSNVGRPELPERLGPDLALEALWFSPPVRMPSGLALGVAASDRGLFATLRHGPELFDRDAAAEFSSRFASVLLGD
jgi:NRPS condensation-like uncharacterized protein